MPKLTIILPVYNGAEFLEKCINSILANTFKDFELIIVNDGSTDGTAAICDKFSNQDKRVIVCHNSNHGVSYSRNYGIERANGEWVGFVDADDWIAPDAFQTITDNIDSDKTDLISFGLWSVSKDQVFAIDLPSMCNGKFSFMREQLLRGWTVVWNTFFRKDFLNRYGLRFKLGRIIGEDFELLFRAYFYARNIAVIEKPLYYYNRMNENSALHRMTIKQYDEIIAANLSVAQFYKDNNIYNIFKDVLAWKILRAKQDYVLDASMHEKFLRIYPESHRYILSCPTLNRKIKLMMWLLTHKMGWITRLIVGLRNKVKNIDDKN